MKLVVPSSLLNEVTSNRDISEDILKRVVKEMFPTQLVYITCQQLILSRPYKNLRNSTFVEIWDLPENAISFIKELDLAYEDINARLKLKKHTREFTLTNKITISGTAFCKQLVKGKALPYEEGQNYKFVIPYN